MPPRPAPPIPATSAGKTNVFLVDGYALIYRAFFAMIARPLTTKSGENTSAVWGITNFLLRLYENYHPEYIGWVHDRGVSFRQAQYPEYKATREKLGEELQQDFDRSLERVCQILDAFHIPVIAINGFEADDVVATLAGRAAQTGLQAVIVSGDKDFYQLIGDGVALLNPGRGGQAAVEEQWVDQSNASERLGVPPERVVDYLALVGDTSDNIPGVKGIGDKTAVQLLETYGDLDTILAKAAEISGKRPREALLAQSDNARLSRQLVTLRRDVPVELDLEQLRVRTPDTKELASLFTELEFRTLIPKLTDLESVGIAPAAAEEGATQAPAPRSPRAVQAADPRIVTDPAELPAMIADLRAASLVAVQTEPALAGLSLAAAPGRSWYLPLGHRVGESELDTTAPHNLPALTSDALAPLRALLADPAVRKAGHDIKGAWVALARAGVPFAGVAYDSMIASFVLDPGRRSHALDDLAREHLSVELRTTTQLVGKDRTFAEVPPAEAAGVSAAQAEMVLRLEEAFRSDISEHHLTRLLDEIEIPLIPVLVDMEAAGILVDRVLLGEMSREFNKEMTGLELDIYRAAGGEFNINSTPQLRTVLFERLKLPVQKRTKTGASTDVEVLEQLAAMGHEVPRLLIEYRELTKLKSTYIDALPGYIAADGRVHTSFNQTGAATGRLSSSDPNLQNIPVRTRRGGEIRRAFVAPPGQLLLIADYSQVELRLLAHLSEDPAFVAAFQRGGDIHRQTAAVIFGVPEANVTAEMRGRAKTINFATIYGQGALALSRQLGITLEEAKAFIKQYFERFAGVRAWLDRTIDEARQRGFVETLFGRRRYIPELRDRNFSIRSFGERTATNSPLQGSAADLIKIAMIRIHAALKQANLRSRMLLQVHDELVLEIPEEERSVAGGLVKREMEGVASLRVPLVVTAGAGKNWIDAKG